MESSYGIGVKNRYELFYDDEGDPTELLRQQEEEKERRKAEKTTAKDKTKGPVGAPQKGVKAPVSTTGKKIKEISANKTQERSIAPRDDNKQQLQRTARPDRAVKFAPPSGRENQQDFEERKNRRNRDERIPTGGSENRFDYGSRDRGDGEVRRGGRGGGLGGRGGFRGRGRGGFAGGPEGGRPGFAGRGGYDGRGKREFERQSGSDRSGVKPVDKKGGEGAYNWGTVNDDLEVQLSPFGEENVTETADKSGDETAVGENAADTSKDSSGAAGEEGAAAENAADDAREMTLDEYKREQEQKRSRASFNIRKAGEGGEEKAEWKKMYVLKKKITDEDGDEEEEEESEEEDEYMRRGRQRQLVDIEINFADQRRGRGGRGGRGIGRGGPGRGGGFGGPRGPPREGGQAGDRPPRGGGYGARGGGGGGGGGEPPKQSAPKVDDWNDFPSLVAA